VHYLTGDIMATVNEIILTEQQIVDSVKFVDLLECGQSLLCNDEAQFEQIIIENELAEKVEFQPTHSLEIVV